ncbi:hypothetical protein AC629_12845 [Bradyrhizobium sp. NAS80.1]|nr:hypothetical protein AC629_12845 [Bradyrhizobium sp. NAS80.1]
MTLAAASFWNSAANLGLLGSAILLFLATFVLWQTADRKEELWDADKADANLKIAELNKEAANAKLETERLRLRFAWRTMDKDQRSRISSKLKKYSGQRFEIVTYTSDIEAANFGAKIHEALRDAGWIYVKIASWQTVG